MRATVGFLSVLVALWLVGTLVKSQLTALKPVPGSTQTLQPAGEQTPQQVQLQFKESLDRAMQTTRKEPDGAAGAVVEGKP